MSDLKSLAHSLLNFKGYASWVKRLQEVDTELDQLRAENERLNDLLKTHKVLENFKSYEKCAKDLAHHKQLLVEAKEALNFIYDDADFESLEEEARIYPVLRKVLAHINQALGETTPPTSTEK